MDNCRCSQSLPQSTKVICPSNMLCATHIYLYMRSIYSIYIHVYMRYRYDMHGIYILYRDYSCFTKIWTCTINRYIWFILPRYIYIYQWYVQHITYITIHILSVLTMMMMMMNISTILLTYSLIYYSLIINSCQISYYYS
jgi:hypothetical protein